MRFAVGISNGRRPKVATADRSASRESSIPAAISSPPSIAAFQSLTSANNPQAQIWFLLYAQLRRVDGQAYRNLLLGKLRGQRHRDIGIGNIQGNDSFAPSLIAQFTPDTSGIAQVQSIPVEAAFSQGEVDTMLKDLLLPTNTALSVLAVELFNLEYLVTRDPAGEAAPRALPAALAGTRLVAATSTAVATPRATATDQVIGDPLGDELGSQRILRVSPLTPVPANC
jgi:hypothetical protein